MARREVLPNGMTLLVDESHVSPIAALALWVRAGAADEPEEHSGVFHFLEHMLLKDTGGDGAATLAGIVQDAGGYLNARTGLDHTAFYQVVPSTSWRDVLASMHATLAGASFADADVGTERRVVIEEGKMSERDPSSFVWRRLMEGAFPDSGYGRPIVGTEDSVGRIDARVLSSYVADAYTPSNMVQVVAGDVDTDEVVAAARELAERGVMAGSASAGGEGSAGARVDAAAPVWAPARAVFTGDLRQPYLGVAFKTPPVAHADTPALDALCGLLGLGRSSRLRKSLRTSLGLVSDIGAAAVGHRDVGIVVARCVGSEGASVERIVEEMFREFRRLKDAPVSPAEAAKSIRRLEAGYALEHETVETMAMTLGFFEAMGDYRYAEDYIDRLAELTPGDLLRAANEYLDVGEASIVAYVPEGNGTTTESLSSAAELGDASSAEPVVKEAPTQWGGAAAFTRPNIIRESPKVEISSSTTEGGARLVVRETPGVPLVSVALGFRGGFTDESDAACGLTGLTLKHMLRGTAGRSAEQLADDVEGLGSGISMSVDRDGFGVGLTVLSSHLGDALEILGDAVCEPALLAETFDAVRAEALSEIGEAEDHPLRRTMRRLMPLLFPEHPYGRPIGGTRESLGSMRADATSPWHARHFVGRSLYACVVGGVSADRAAEVIRESFGRLPSTEAPEPGLSEPSPPRGRVEEDLGRPGQSSVAVGFGGPRVGTVESTALHVASSSMTMMGGRLWRALRERPPFAYSVRAIPVPMRLGGALVGHVTTPPGEEEAAVSTFVDELDALARDGLTPDELERGRRYLAGLIEISMQRGAARAASYAAAEVAGVGYGRIDRLPDIIRNVTNDDIVRAARLYVTAEDEPAVVILRG